MIHRRNFLTGLFVAPAIIPAHRLMASSFIRPEMLSIRSPYELLYPESPAPLLTKTTAVVRGRKLSAEWTFKEPESLWINPDMVAKLVQHHYSQNCSARRTVEGV